MSHLIPIELDDEVVKQLIIQLRRAPYRAIDDLPDLLFALEEAIDKDDG